ncbi:hypothetical protein NA56DRAFT_261065 [Hyaloscypha hepaticicola]|uniref:Uncharacterized protein n=1 Tax=Hyaloscypha hepaticicola TaxID=2082293 RepID=A0A2J6PV49_9HELO|nr:hypothetical protein NA56DRAFT_261065 [Hyaloscypha hepaticicola]
MSKAYVATYSFLSSCSLRLLKFAERASTNPPSLTHCLQGQRKMLSSFSPSGSSSKSALIRRIDIYHGALPDGRYSLIGSISCFVRYWKAERHGAVSIGSFCFALMCYAIKQYRGVQAVTQNRERESCWTPGCGERVRLATEIFLLSYKGHMDRALHGAASSRLSSPQSVRISANQSAQAQHHRAF